MTLRFTHEYENLKPIFGANPNIGGIAYHITERNTPDEPKTPFL